MNLLLIEDEDLAVEKLRQTIWAVEKEAVIAGVAHSIETAVQWLQTHPAPDLILMDIELSDGQSFEIFKQVEVTSPVIFTTSYDEYAIKAFKVNSIDYLLKPIEEGDLKTALDKYRKLEAKQKQHLPLDVANLVKVLQQQLRPADYRCRFLVKQGQRLLAIEVAEIAFFFSQGRVAHLVTWDKQKYVVDYTLEELEQMLDPQQFFRANRGFIVHLKSVRQMHLYFNGKLKLELKPAAGEDVIVSREKAGSFKEWMGR